MKIIITGHTRGIGAAIKKYFEDKGHTVIGFSKSTGYDISNPIVREKIANLSADADIFVNNAFNDIDDSQSSLLKKIFNKWQGQDKKIINISTRYTQSTDLYSIKKKRLDEFCNENIYQQPKIINIKPGLVDTDRAKNINQPKMDANEIVKILDWILQQDIQIHSITFGK
jgi:NADP-dependent 3-hydroxy acid dehydrogenase YdfG